MRRARKTKTATVEDDDAADLDLDDEDDEADETDERDDEDSDEPADERTTGDPAARPPRVTTLPPPRGRRRLTTVGRPSAHRAMQLVDADQTDIATWPGTAEAARMVGKHTSTIKSWRETGKIRAQLDESGCWRYHPDDLAEAMDSPDGTDPGTVLALGMNAIVQQGGAANERLLQMTRESVEGLKAAVVSLTAQLEDARIRIKELEGERTILLDKAHAQHLATLEHDRKIRKIDHAHERAMAVERASEERVTALLAMLGPVAMTLGARLLGQEERAEAIEREMVGASGARAPAPDARTPAARDPADKPTMPSPPSPVPASAADHRLVPFETRVADAMARLAAALRALDAETALGLGAMLPPTVSAAIATVRRDGDPDAGRALAIIVRSAQQLPAVRFKALAPLAPKPVVDVLAELRTLLDEESPP